MQMEIRSGIKRIFCLKGFGKTAVLLFSWTLFFCNVTSAQSTRAEELAQEQEKKSKQVAPYVPNKAERISERLQNFFQQPRGFYPMILSTYPSGGFALGAGYRATYGDSGWWDLHGGWSVKNYKMVDTTLHLPELGLGALKTDINAHFVDATQVRFYGKGNDTSQENETNYGFQPISVGVTETVTPVWWFGFGGSVDYLTYETSEGSGSTPSTDEVFDPVTAPGLGIDFEYLRPRAFVQIDWREGLGYTTSGGLYRVDWSKYSERDLSGFDFDRVDVEVDQFIPLLRANWVIALRGLVSITNIDDGDQVPFFLLPSLGGSSRLRGYDSFRFTDRHRLLLVAEYRWRPSKFLDMAFFYEAGKVASQRSDLDLEDLHDSYGIGARFHSPILTALRIELARSREGTRLIFTAGPSF